MRVLGFMSGTSLDGVDAAILETDGETVSGFGPALTVPFAEEERAVLVRATEAARALDAAGALEGSGRAPFAPEVARFEAGRFAGSLFDRAGEAVVAAHGRAAQAVLACDGGAPVELAGFHGQTVLHRPERRLSAQLGDPARLAARLGVPVVADLRQADLAAGGQGAPLVPVYHAALAERLGGERPIAFLNIGGVANLSWIGRDGRMTAFDTGPGNGLIDELVQARGHGLYDADGRLAAAGRECEPVLEGFMAHPYFRRPAPKSLDRHDFSIDAVDGLAIGDAAATLAELTAASVEAACALLDEAPDRWIVCGGGRRNPEMMRRLRGRLGCCEAAEAVGLRGDFVEAEAFAFLAARSVRGLPITFSGTTGVAGPLTGGRCYRP